MTAPIPIQLRVNTEITFREITLRGELTHVPEDRLLVITSDTEEEVLTTETPESDLTRAEVAVVEGVLPRQLLRARRAARCAGVCWHRSHPQPLQHRPVQLAGRGRPGPLIHHPTTSSPVCLSTNRPPADRRMPPPHTEDGGITFLTASAHGSTISPIRRRWKMCSSSSASMAALCPGNPVSRECY